MSCSTARTEFHRHKTRVARKEHVCRECKEIILKGELYEYYAGKQHDERPWEAKLCIQCDQDWKEIIDVESDFSDEARVCFGELEERVQNAFRDGLINGHPLVNRWVPLESQLAAENSEGETEVLVARPHPSQLSFSLSLV